MRRLLIPSVLLPVSIALLALFLFGSHALGLVSASTAKAKATATVEAKTPVVLIVYDELNTVSLLDAEGKVDAVRYPRFASLARDATWFRSATTSHRATMGAIRAILTGDLPGASNPFAFAVSRKSSDSPQSLFSLLAKSHRMSVFEPLLLCPRTLCPVLSALTRKTGEISNSLVLDTYLRLLRPVRKAASREIEACWMGACDFAASISAGEKPTLYFMHEVLPHVPYITLPSGRRYDVSEPDLATANGRANGRWLEDWPARQTEQRYLLQVGYTDRALGVVLRRLREAGIYDRALVIVTSDHGCSHRAGGDQRRLPTSSNLDDIAFVPLFVKLPGQTKGTIDDSLARSIDILPTIAHVLGIPLPWHVDGRPLIGRRLPADGTVVVQSDSERFALPLSKLRAMRSQTLAQKLASFGTGSFAKVYRIGPNRELLGRSVATLAVRPHAKIEAKLENPSRAALDEVDPGAEIVPVYLQGTISGEHAAKLELAIALNGRIRALTRTYVQAGVTRFAAIVPERALRRGRNIVAVFSVSGSGRRARLERLRLSGS